MNPSLSDLNLSALPLDYFLTAGHAVGNGVKLTVGGLYTWGFLIGGPLLMLAGVLLVKVMYARVQFFALEFGNGGSLGRMKAIAPFIALGTALLLLGGGGAYLGWQTLDYSVTLTAAGLSETRHGATIRYEWADVQDVSKRIKSTEFFILFAKDGRKCRVIFQQRLIGEILQDKAIAIAENALSSVPVPKRPP